MKRHDRVALLQYVPLRFKSLKPKEYAERPQTIGQHIRKRRLQLRLTQREAARLLKVDPFTVLNWEKEHTEPRVADGRRLIAFLGYDPFGSPTTVGEMLIHERRKRGWSIAQAACHAGVDRSTFKNWERGGAILRHCDQLRVAKLLQVDPTDLLKQMRVGETYPTANVDNAANDCQRPWRGL